MDLGITAIDHVQIAVPRAWRAEALAFYREVLGLAEIPKPAELRARGGAWFQTGNLQLHIGVDPDPEGPPPPRSKRHVCFLVADLAAAKAAALAKGVDHRRRKRGRGARPLLHPRSRRQPHRNRAAVVSRGI